MKPAHTLDSIVSAVDDTLGEFVEVEPMDGDGDLGLTIAGTPDLVEHDTVESSQWSKLVGILFCQPTSSLGKNEIVPHLEYFHHRSDFFVDFFCAGYGADWPRGKGEDENPVAVVDGVRWYFSSKRFNEARAELERKTKWNYSGETDLLLVVARKSPGKTALLDFSTGIACNLEQMTKDEAISSARAFFENIFRLGKKYDGEDPVSRLSDAMGLERGKNFLLDAVLRFLPEPARKLYKTSKHFVVQNISE